MKRFICATLLLAAIGMLGVGCAEPQVQRFGSVTGIRPEKIEYYKKIHAECWPDILKEITDCHIQNYAIYLGETEPGKWYLFSYFEYVGKDFEGDMKKMADDPRTQEWWKHCEPCQLPVPTRKKGEGTWHNMEEVFFHP